MLEQRFLWMATIWGAAIFSATSILATIWSGAFLTINIVVSLSLFAIGFLAFLYAMYVSAIRSRHELLDIAGIFFLTSMPKGTAWRFRGLLMWVVCLAFITSGIRLYTSLAFGLLTPLFVLGIMGILGAKWGTYRERK